MDEQHLVPLLHQQMAEAPGVGDVTGNHDAAGAGMVAPHQLQAFAGIEQYPQGDAAAIAQADRPAQVAGPPTLADFSGQG